MPNNPYNDRPPLRPVSVRLPVDAYNTLRCIALAEDRKITSLVRWAVKGYLADLNENAPKSGEGSEAESSFQDTSLGEGNLGERLDG